MKEANNSESIYENEGLPSAAEDKSVGSSSDKIIDGAPQRIAAVERSRALDNLRGFIIIMLALNSVYAKLMPMANPIAWLGHANINPFNSAVQYGIYLADFGAPVFMLSMAFAAVISYNKTCLAEGRKRANGKFVRRYLALIGVGCAYVLIYKFLDIFKGGDGIYRGNLNVLIIYGFAGLIALLFFRLGKYWRLGIGVALILAFQCLHLIEKTSANGEIVRKAMFYTVSTEFGGLIGSVGWAGFFLICTYFGETYFAGRRKEFYIAIGGSALVAAIFAIGFFLTKDQNILENLVARFFTLNRLMYSAFYLFLTLFTSLICFAFFDLVSKDRKIMFLTAWGKSPLFFYLFGYALYFVCSMLPRNWVFYAVSILFTLAAMMGVAYIFEKKDIKISI